MRALPSDSVDELMGSLEDLATNQTRATASVRLAGGMTRKYISKRSEVNSLEELRQLRQILSRMKPKSLVEYVLYLERRVGWEEMMKIHHFMSCLTPVSKEMLPAGHMGLIVSFVVKIISSLVNARPILLIILG